MQVEEILIIVDGIVEALRAAAFGSMLLFLTFLIFATLFVQVLNPLIVQLAADGLYDNCSWCEDAYSSVWKAFMTLIMTNLAGDSWGALAIPLMTHHQWTFFLVLPVFVIVQLGLVNVISAVIIDRQFIAREKNRELKHALLMSGQAEDQQYLKHLFGLIDADGSNQVSELELSNAYEINQEFREGMDLLGANRGDMDTLFNILDPDKHGSVDMSTFVDRLYYVSNMNERTLLAFIKEHTSCLLSKTDAIQEKMKRFMSKYALDRQEICKQESSLYATNTTSEKADAKRYEFVLDGNCDGATDDGVIKEHGSITNRQSVATQTPAIPYYPVASHESKAVHPVPLHPGVEWM